MKDLLADGFSWWLWLQGVQNALECQASGAAKDNAQDQQTVLGIHLTARGSSSEWFPEWFSIDHSAFSRALQNLVSESTNLLFLQVIYG